MLGTIILKKSNNCVLFWLKFKDLERKKDSRKTKEVKEELLLMEKIAFKTKNLTKKLRI